MNPIRTVLSFLLTSLLLVSLAPAQTTIKSVRKADGTLGHYKESSPGDLNYVVPIAGPLPSDAVPYRGGGRHLVPYTPSANGTLNLAQFGLDLYYSPTFQFQVDFGGWESPDQRRRYGINTFGHWNILDEHRNQLRPGEGFKFLTENFLIEQALGHSFAMESLQTFVSKAYPKVPAMGYGEWANYKYLCYNIERPLYLDPGNYNETPLPGFGGGYYGKAGEPNWHDVKNTVIQLEATNETVTLAQLAARGYEAWYGEHRTRLANRMILLCEMARHKSGPGTRISSGPPIRIAQPNKNDQTSGDTWVSNDGNVSNIGGDSQGNITLTLPGGQLWTVNLSGSLYDHEDFNNMAIGKGHADLTDAEYNDIFVLKKPETQSHAYVWGVLGDDGDVAEEIGMIEHQRQRMRTRLQSHQIKSIVREQQISYESSNYYLPWMPFVPRFGDPNFTDGPKLWFPPVMQATRYMVNRFMAGNEEGNGYHLFPMTQYDCVKNPLTFPDPNYRAFFNHPLHPIEAIFQARVDMQPYELYYTGSTLVEKPDVQLLGTGDFVNYNGIEAFDTYPAPQKPAYKLRWKAVPGGWRVLILGGVKQASSDERVDVIRVPAGGLNGAKFRLKLRGSGAHVYDFLVPTGEVGQTYDALPAVVAGREKAGYRGWINNN